MFSIVFFFSLVFSFALSMCMISMRRRQVYILSGELSFTFWHIRHKNKPAKYSAYSASLVALRTFSKSREVSPYVIVCRI